jgi:hypothetical protein
MPGMMTSLTRRSVALEQASCRRSWCWSDSDRRGLYWLIAEEVVLGPESPLSSRGAGDVVGQVPEAKGSAEEVLQAALDSSGWCVARAAPVAVGQDVGGATFVVRSRVISSVSAVGSPCGHGSSGPELGAAGRREEPAFARGLAEAEAARAPDADVEVLEAVEHLGHRVADPVVVRKNAEDPEFIRTSATGIYN